VKQEALVTDWTIPGAEGEPIIGNCHLPDGEPAGVVLVAHGFKGYKDYGMCPPIARECAAAGFVAHRFNFSHSGMTNQIETFERPDLFERDTWNRQVDDQRRVIDAVATGRIAGCGLPVVCFGHSRGGVTVLLTAGRGAGDEAFPAPAGLVTAAAPSRCASLPADEAEKLLRTGYLASPSSRTGQVLRVGRAFLQEQRDDPEAHDLLALTSRIRCPVLIVHGADDPTVPAVCADELTAALGARARRSIVPGGDHVFNTANPMPEDAPMSEQLAALVEALTRFSREVCRSPGAR
jgi:dienelactone hydrolase